VNDQLDLYLERTLDTPRDLVWKAWTDAEHIKRWWSPRPYQTPECEIELRPGGKFFTRMTGPDGFDYSRPPVSWRSSPVSGSSGRRR